MGASLPADFNFQPKVWKDHISAYFDQKIVWAAIAAVDRELTGSPGETVNFPFFKSIPDAEEPAADEALQVDPLQDDAFQCTIKEVGKGVGVKDAALRKSATRRERIFEEIQRQIGRRFAEKVDDDLVSLVNTTGNHVDGFTATTASEVATITRINTAVTSGFGDRSDEAVALYMHSLHIQSLLNDPTAKFLQADASDPFYAVPGFRGRLLGMAVIASDVVPAGSALGGKKSFHAFAMKPDPYGLCLAQEPEIETDRDILNREFVFAGTQWYGTVGLHSKIDAEDKRVTRMLFATDADA